MPSIFLASSNYPPYLPAGVSRPYSADVERLYSVAEDAAQESPASSRQHSRKSHRRLAPYWILLELLKLSILHPYFRKTSAILITQRRLILFLLNFCM